MTRNFIIGLLIFLLSSSLIGLSACGSGSVVSNTSDNTCAALPDLPVVPQQPVISGSTKPDKVELVYFHAKNPCHCMAVVGDNIKYSVDTYFANETANGRLKLTMVVSDDPANAGLVKQYNAMLFALFVREIRGGQERIYPVGAIWEMTGDGNRERLVQFMKATVTAMLEGKI